MEGLEGTVFEIKTLPNTASQLVEAIYNQKDLTQVEAMGMAQYLDKRYDMSDFVQTGPEKYGDPVQIHKVD